MDHPSTAFHVLQLVQIVVGFLAILRIKHALISMKYSFFHFMPASPTPRKCELGCRQLVKNWSLFISKLCNTFLKICLVEQSGIDGSGVKTQSFLVFPVFVSKSVEWAECVWRWNRDLAAVSLLLASTSAKEDMTACGGSTEKSRSLYLLALYYITLCRIVDGMIVSCELLS